MSPWQRDETRILRTAEQDSDYMSPLYHSVFVGKSDAAEKITKAHANELLNCGPNGQNVLHVAALRSKGMKPGACLFQSCPTTSSSWLLRF